MYEATDSVHAGEEETDQTAVPVEFLRAHNPSSLPPDIETKNRCSYYTIPQRILLTDEMKDGGWIHRQRQFSY
jgi:hypothetical protein